MAYELPKTYRWIRHEPGAKLLRRILRPIARLTSFVYCRCILHITVENQEALKAMRFRGCFLFGNHNHIPGDGFIPIYLNGAKPADILTDADILETPYLGPLMPYIGMLPIPTNLRYINRLRSAININLHRAHTIVIYPEGKNIDFCPEIRPFHKTSFRFAVENNAPCYSFTTTFQPRKNGQPKATVYIDGPFTVPPNISRKEQQELLMKQIHQKMTERLQNNTYKAN
ncbi:MAG: 1-acyl-sn-glycerol-3-phosphate acyltransferase [Firmicutes bacterium]|nr:1-acyl-sn-glycerol-3-phosphate acyltransferase [Bacillota bacterium]